MMTHALIIHYVQAFVFAFFATAVCSECRWSFFLTFLYGYL